MVCYCCVKGCKNNSNIKKKDPNSIISFHAFPSNTELKSKWLKAIGRPNWDPPNHTRLCSKHFDFEQISHEGCRTRIKDDACPTKHLPLNSNFEASYLKVCRMCLATDRKMYSLQSGILYSCIEAMSGLTDNNHIEGLPQFVCYECGACLIKCYNLKEKSMIAQATLLDIFAKNGKLTLDLIKEQDRNELNLKSLLNIYNQTNVFNYIHNNDDPFSSNETDDNNRILKSDCFEDIKQENDLTFNINEGISKDVVRINKAEIEDDISEIDRYSSNEHVAFDDFSNNESTFVDDIKDCISKHDDSLDDSKANGMAIKSLKKKRYNCKQGKIVNRKIKKKNMIGFTPSEINMQKYFDIVTLSLQEQIEEWKRTTTKRLLTGETVFECAICMKIFAHNNTYQTHVLSHDPGRGKEECPICKLRFKNEVLMQSHKNRTHGKKFYCKLCVKVFNNVSMAKKHHRWHSGYRYKCSWCPFASAHESALGVHARTHHKHEQGARSCARCGLSCVSERGLALHVATAHRDQPEIEANQDFRCEKCDINFATEGARRVHLLTSTHHRDLDLCDTSIAGDSIKRTCSKCGQEFSSVNDLIQHTKSEHRRGTRKKTTWSLPGDSYPTLCEHCGKSVNNRKEHWWHVREQHPKEKHSYQPVITAVCDICGKGFQNSTKLHLHELRHGHPTVKCDHCPRIFYDKYAMARHTSVHEPSKPHSCRMCGRTFRLKGNLHRHSRVHTGVTPYECTMCGKKFKYSTSVNLHVRTVHYKLPHPPRKKRARMKNDSSELI